jgi:hypothetical protein
VVYSNKLPLNHDTVARPAIQDAGSSSTDREEHLLLFPAAMRSP